MKTTSSASLICFLFIAQGCAPLDGFDDESPWVEGQLGTLRAGLTVGQAGGCSTSIVNALSRQLIDEINCLRPNTLVDFTGANMALGNAVWPYLQGRGPQDLQAAINRQGQVLNINSALRTLPQQYLLYKWYQAGQCGIALAAQPGRSRHESGLAIDIGNNAAWRQSLEAHSFDWLGASDPVHFDYAGAGVVSLTGLSVRAFQRLWNRNHPEDEIEEDGLYGPQTEGRLTQSPAEGFALGGCMMEEPDVPDMQLPIPADMADLHTTSDAILVTDSSSPPDVIGTETMFDAMPDGRVSPLDFGRMGSLDIGIDGRDGYVGPNDPYGSQARQKRVMGSGGCSMAEGVDRSAILFLGITLLGLGTRKTRHTHRH